MKTVRISVAVFFVILSFASAQNYTTLSGTLTADTTLRAAQSPWHINGDVIVPDGITLVIEAGTTIYFSERTGIAVTNGGRLIAEGNENSRIKMSHLPDSAAAWEGISFDASMEENRLAFIDMEYADQRANIILIRSSKIIIDNLTWTSTNKNVIEADHPSAIIKNSIFPNVSSVEVIHGQSLTGNEYFIVQGNTFGKPTEYYDVIDFSDCKRPGPILQVYNNTFLGGGDDGLDLDGCDAHIEGNVFMSFHKDHTGTSTSNAIATGFRFERTSDIMVVRNLFVDNDHAVLLKEDCFMHAENNTFVNSAEAVINFSEWPDREVIPGKGAFLDGNIFWNNDSLFQNQISQPGDPNPSIVVNRSIAPVKYHYLGTGNIDANPLFVDPANDFHLHADSPAKNTGPNALDMGAYIPAGASISGEPEEVTESPVATLVIGGAGITRYAYSINDSGGPWSTEFAITTNPEIHLANLINGQMYTVYVKGKNFAGEWQTNPDYAVSKTWKIQTNTLVESLNYYPEQFELYQNIPNPFNPSTKIYYYLPLRSRVTMQIFDVTGRIVEILFDEKQQKGIHYIDWNAASFASGVYYCRLQAGTFAAVKKLLLLR